MSPFVTLSLAIAFGLVVSILHLLAHRERPIYSLWRTLLLIAPLIAMSTMAVGSNLAAAFTLFGTLAIVRFRTPIKNPLDAAFVIFSVVIGLAIIIGLAQLTLFKRPHEDDDHGDGHRRLSGGFGVFDEGGWISGAEAAWAATICIVAYTITQYFPKITKKVPPSLVAIVVATGVEHCIARPCGYKTQLVIDFADVKGPFPVPVWMQNKYAMPSFSAMMS